jgi:hypothetical protein
VAGILADYQPVDTPMNYRTGSHLLKLKAPDPEKHHNSNLSGCAFGTKYIRMRAVPPLFMKCLGSA